MPEIPILLEAQPEVGAHTRHARKAKRRIRRNAALRVDYLVQPRERNSETNRERGLSNSQRHP